MALDVKISFSWTDYCRLCLLDNGIMLPIFEGEGRSRQIGHKIQTCLQLVTYDGDPLPRKICHTCLFKVNQTYEFRAMALQSFEKLRAHLLPLKHTTEVREYLEKSKELHKPVDANGTDSVPYPIPCSPSQRESHNVLLRGVQIKSERDAEEISDSMQWKTSSFSQLNTATLESSLLNTSFISTPKSNKSSLTCTGTASGVGTILNDSSKRKRIGLSEDDSTNSGVHGQVQAGPKSMKRKRPLAGPASRKKNQNSDLKCVFCSTSFRNQSSLQLHLDNCLKCSTCKEEFLSVAEKAIHEAEKHITVAINAEKKLLKKSCSLCPSKFASNVMLNMHFENVHRSKVASLEPAPPSTGEGSREVINYKEMCNDPDSEDGLLLSNRVQGKINTNICPRCFEVIGTSQDHSCLNGEAMAHKCIICNDMLPSEPTLNEHLKVVHGQFKCVDCSALFTSLVALNGHQRAHSKKKSTQKKESIFKKTLTSNQQKGLSCHTCYEEFQDEDAFVLHLYRHATEQSDDEKLPKKKSRKSQDTTSRGGATTTSSKEEPEEQFIVKCEQCWVVCRSKEHYKVHLATHVSKAKTKFPCTGCIQDFRNVEALNRHTCRGKQQDGIQTCCLDCGQNLVENEDHVCDNKCPECDRVFKSARGQRLHFSSKHKASSAHGDLCNEELLGSEANHVDSEEEQIESGEDMAGKQRSPDATGGESCDLVKCSPLGDSPPRERLPPDGAPLDDPLPCRFDSHHKPRAPSPSCVNVLQANENRLPAQTKDLWPYGRIAARDGKSNDSDCVQSASEHVH